MSRRCITTPRSTPSPPASPADESSGTAGGPGQTRHRPPASPGGRLQGWPPEQPGRRSIGDVIGGFVAGLHSVPEGIGCASLAGIDPMFGIHAGMVPVTVAPRRPGRFL